MKQFLASIFLALAAVLFLASCGTGSSAEPPTVVTAVAGDGSVTLTWDMEPGVEYWVFSAAADSVTPENCSSLPECQTIMSAASPRIVSGLTNGTTYSFTINGRIDGGPGGTGSVSISAVPRLAGATWNTGTSLGSANLHGVAYGTAFLAVGSGGTMFSSADGTAWTALNSGVAADLNAAIYGNASYVAAGAGGVILRSTDELVTWTQLASGTTNDLYAMAYNGSLFLAVGANGTLITSYDGTNWTTQYSGTSSHLYGVAYGNGVYVAVGAGGTLQTSSDGITWQAALSQTTLDLKGVAYGADIFVAIGTAGALLTSTDGITWTPQTPIASSPALNAVIYGSQFVAVGNGGAIYTSTDGISWATPSSGNTNNLYAVTYGNHGYSAVGATGSNLSAF
ncbi:MAG: hypothetical protein Q8O38_08015 [Sulfurimicrobium sp.]|nr:hypothetical protein [Sulfurimicrobium sp.]